MKKLLLTTAALLAFAVSSHAQTINTETLPACNSPGVINVLERVVAGFDRSEDNDLKETSFANNKRFCTGVFVGTYSIEWKDQSHGVYHVAPWVLPQDARCGSPAVTRILSKMHGGADPKFFRGEDQLGTRDGKIYCRANWQDELYTVEVIEQALSVNLVNPPIDTTDLFGYTGPYFRPHTSSPNNSYDTLYSRGGYSWDARRSIDRAFRR